MWCWRRLLKVSKEIKPVNLKGDQPWIFTGSWSSSILVIWYEKMTHWKSPWCWERLRAKEKRASEDEMAGRHHWCNKHELGQTPEDGEGQGGLACCSPWGRKESDTTERQATATACPLCAYLQFISVHIRMYLFIVHISLHKITCVIIWYYALHNKPKQI